MGLFSFFTGSKPDHDAGPSNAASDPPKHAGADAQESGASANAVSDQPGGWDINTDALTAPPPAQPDAPTVGPADADATAALQGPIIEVLKTVYDPEIPVDIYELGLIYDIIVDAERQVLVKMTLTSPACPAAQQLPGEVRYKVKAVPGVSEAIVDIVWEPPWDKSRMSDAARLQLGFF